MSQNLNFQLGLLHCAHLLVAADGVIDKREIQAMNNIKKKEGIPDNIFHDFTNSIGRKSEREFYEEGINYLNRCSEEEKLSAFVHLYRLSQADKKTHVKEVRLMLYSLKATNIEFEDVELNAAGARKRK